ncbi:cytochrome c biogenesis protein ResB [Streptomyces subrutilus]|uniref:cytochrome c biogenesis protein ResB n=1 Tax=Streptomyces subrutilus TaxID=36818 RepID=UPI002E15C83E|nr:cytochrome c biogenesis protein ResB [Streptomyces subrutilus]
MSTTDKAPEAAPQQSEDPAEPALGAAGAQLSTAPLEDGPEPAAVGIGVIGWARWFWRQLTSMRVALILLFMLSLGAIPGSLIPQTDVDAMKVAQWQRAHEFWVPVAEKLQLFDVYTSFWFSAIYLLLFVSLIGCILPRTWQFVGQLRGRPPVAPRRLDRLPAHTTWRTEKSPDEVLAHAGTLLGRRRFRTRAGTGHVAAEKGYLREAGNLIFHVALIVMLVAFAWGKLYKYEGGKLVLRGSGFSNTLTQYDDFKRGSFFDPDDLPPFSFTLDRFDATYQKTGPQKGTPRDFKAHITYYDGPHGAPRKADIEVNKPLDVDGSKVYLLGHGYAPVISVTDPTGKVVFRDAVPMLPQDANLTSAGAIKVTDGYRNAKGEKEQLGFSAQFVPTFAGKGKGTMLSQFPAADFPVIALNAFHGSLGVDSGLLQNVYQLDTTKMQQFKKDNGDPFAQMLLPGETMTLPGGAGTVKFESVERWATFSVTHQPGSGLALAGAIAAIAGLAGSLFIQRRRIWVRAVAGEDGVTVVEMAGLGRSESARLPQELADLAGALHEQAPSAPAPVEEEGERG